jgi:hypothetical protein
LVRLDPFIPDILIETIGHFLWNKNNLSFPPAFGFPKIQLSILDISCCQFKYLTNSHPASGHQLDNESISGFVDPENNLIDHIFLNNGPCLGFGFFKQFFKGRSITRILKFGIKCVYDKIKKGSEVGIPVALSGLFVALG